MGRDEQVALMIRILVGNTAPLSRKSSSDSKQKALAYIEDVDWEKLSDDELLAMATTLSLMGDSKVFRMSGALNGARADEFLKVAAQLQQSPHLFIFTEEKLLKKPTDLMAKAGAQITQHAPTKTIEGFNMFSITFLFAARDRKKLWLSLLDSGQRGVVAEAFVGMLHWKVRDMLSKNETNIYTKVELRKISMDLVVLYHDSHRGAGDLALLLERYILRL